MADAKMKVNIIAPDRTFFAGDVSFAEFNTIEGIIGVYPRHIPMTVVIAPGVLKLKTDEGEKEAALHSGFAEILGDSIKMLAESVEWPEEIDVQRAEEAKKRAERRLAEHPDGLDVLRAETALHRAMARIVVVK